MVSLEFFIDIILSTAL